MSVYIQFRFETDSQLWEFVEFLYKNSTDWETSLEINIKNWRFHCNKQFNYFTNTNQSILILQGWTDDNISFLQIFNELKFFSFESIFIRWAKRTWCYSNHKEIKEIGFINLIHSIFDNSLTLAQDWEYNFTKDWDSYCQSLEKQEYIKRQCEEMVNRMAFDCISLSTCNAIESSSTGSLLTNNEKNISSIINDYIRQYNPIQYENSVEAEIEEEINTNEDVLIAQFLKSKGYNDFINNVIESKY
jgi:hypothetical protein